MAEAGKRFPVWQVDPRLLYGQLHRIKSGYKLKSMYIKALCGSREELKNAFQSLDLSGKIMTAYIERVNLTLRELIPPVVATFAIRPMFCTRYAMKRAKIIGPYASN